MALSQCKLGMKWWQTHVDASKTVADMQKKKKKKAVFACHYTIIALLSLNYGNACSWVCFLS